MGIRQQTFEDYDGFVAKFKPTKTTDDCYTPPEVFEAVKNWACEKYGLDETKIIRPFQPGGDYESEEYPADCIVLDNPPFSILTKITRFYMSRNIRFFLFAPHLTNFSTDLPGLTHVISGSSIVYENGARVPTGFLHNLTPDIAVTTAPDLLRTLEAANHKAVERRRRENVGLLSSERKRAISKGRYTYPDEVLTAAMCEHISRAGITFEVPRTEVSFARSLDSQKPLKKSIFGAGFLLSEKKAAEKKTAEKKAAEKKTATVWQLSDREKQIITRLSENH